MASVDTQQARLSGGAVGVIRSDVVSVASLACFITVARLLIEEKNIHFQKHEHEHEAAVSKAQLDGTAPPPKTKFEYDPMRTLTTAFHEYKAAGKVNMDRLQAVGVTKLDHARMDPSSHPTPLLVRVDIKDVLPYDEQARILRLAMAAEAHSRILLLVVAETAAALAVHKWFERNYGEMFDHLAYTADVDMGAMDANPNPVAKLASIRAQIRMQEEGYKAFPKHAEGWMGKLRLDLLGLKAQMDVAVAKEETAARE